MSGELGETKSKPWFTYLKSLTNSPKFKLVDYTQVFYKYKCELLPFTFIFSLTCRFHCLWKLDG